MSDTRRTFSGRFFHIFKRTLQRFNFRSRILVCERRKGFFFLSKECSVPIVCMEIQRILDSEIDVLSNGIFHLEALPHIRYNKFEKKFNRNVQNEISRVTCG